MTSIPTQQADRKDNPAAPAPNSTPQDIQRFFTDVFLAKSPSLSQSEAEEMAKTLPVNGQGLYMLDKETFKKAFGCHGTIFYKILQNGKYGSVS